MMNLDSRSHVSGGETSVMGTATGVGVIRGVTCRVVASLSDSTSGSLLEPLDE